MERVIAYIDGYNLYYGLRDKGWKWAYWLNLQALAQRILKPHQTLVETKYFTSIITLAESRRKRQAIFIEALQTLNKFHIYYGHFLPDPVTCKNCNHTYTTFHEKMTDVNIAVEMMADAAQDRFDTALLVSADSDLVGMVKTIRKLFKKKVVVAFPPKRYSNDLIRACNGHTHIGRNVFYQSLFPDELTKPNGYVLRRPARWR